MIESLYPPWSARDEGFQPSRWTGDLKFEATTRLYDPSFYDSSGYDRQHASRDVTLLSRVSTSTGCCTITSQLCRVDASLYCFDWSKAFCTNQLRMTLLDAGRIGFCGRPQDQARKPLPTEGESLIENHGILSERLEAGACCTIAAAGVTPLTRSTWCSMLRIFLP